MSNILDFCLTFAIVGFAVAIVCVRTLFTAVVLFISLGLIMSLAWLRLGAGDVALAEAALGAGVSGAMLLLALRRLEASSGGRE